MDFIEAKRKKERGMTNKEFHDGIKPYITDSDIAVSITLSKEGEVNTWYTSDSALQALGMLDVARAQILEDMNRR